MNAVATSEADFIITDNGGAGSDSDSNSDDSTTEYYQPISTLDGENENENEEINHHHHHHHHELPNGYGYIENGVSSIDLSDDDDDDDDDKDDEERVRESEIERAVREEERRRNAPLTAENAGRVMEAMRGISFRGSVPDWAGRVPEGSWVDLLRTGSGTGGGGSFS